LAQRQAGQLPENTPTPNSLANYVRPNARLGVSGMAAVEEIAVASDHNILARADKSDAKGLATLAASASPMAIQQSCPFDNAGLCRRRALASESNCLAQNNKTAGQGRSD
jgi:hypothetical protein